MRNRTDRLAELLTLTTPDRPSGAAAACSFPASGRSRAPRSVSTRCTLQPRADASLGCRWTSVAAACAELWPVNGSSLLTPLSREPASLGEGLGYGRAMTTLYGNGMIMSRGMLEAVGEANWEACEQNTPKAIALTENLLRDGISRRAARAGDWHLSRCMLSASNHYPTLLPRRFNGTFEHLRDHGILHERACARLSHEPFRVPAETCTV